MGGFLGSLFKAVASLAAQSTHNLFKGLDEAADYGGGLGFVGAGLKACRELTGHLVDKVENMGMGGHEAPHASPSTGGGLISFVQNKLGKGDDALDVAAAPVKLGRSANFHTFDGVVTNCPFHADFNSIVVPTVGDAGFGKGGAGLATS